MIPSRISLWSSVLLLTLLFPLPLASAEDASVRSEPLLQVEGVLEESDRTLSENKTHYDEYAFTGQAGQTITIVLESTEFDANLFLKNPVGQIIEQNDDYADGNKNSAITVKLPESREYTLVASAYNHEGQGQYRLTVLAGSEPAFLAAEEQIRSLEQTLEDYRRQGDRYNQAETLYKLGEVYQDLEQDAQALKSYKQALEIYRSMNEISDAAFTLSKMGNAYFKLEQYSEALDSYQQALVAFEQVDDRHQIGVALWYLGTVYEKLEQFDQAVRSHQQALEIAQQNRDALQKALSLSAIGGTHISEGQSLRQKGLYAESIPLFEQAIEPLQQAQKIAQKINDSQVEHTVIKRLWLATLNIGLSFDDQYQYTEAIVAYQQTLNMLEAYQDRFSEAEFLERRMTTLGQLGLAYSRSTQYAQALTAYQESAQIAAQIGNIAKQVEQLRFVAVAYEDVSEYSQALEINQQILAIVREKLPEDQEAEMYALTLLAKAYGNINQYDIELKTYEHALVIARELHATYIESSLLSNIGLVHNYRGQYLQALEWFQQAWSINQSAIERLQTNEPLVIEELCGESFTSLGIDGYQGCQEIYQTGKAQLLNNLGSVYDNLGHYAEALDAYQQALANAQKRNDLDDQATYLTNMSTMYLSTGDYVKASTLLQQALKIATAAKDRSQKIVVLSNLGYSYHRQGQYPRALELYQQSLEIAQEINDQRSEAFVLGGIGSVYASQGNLTTALNYHHRAVSILQDLGVSSTTNLNNIGTVYANQGKYVEAIEIYQQALESFRSTSDREGESTVLANLADTYMNQSDYAKAIELQQEGLEIRRQIGNRPGEINDLIGLGWLNADIGQYDEALSLFQHALSLSQEIGSRPEMVEALAGSAKVYREQQQYSKALELYQQALKLSQDMGGIAYTSRLQQEIGSLYQQQGKSAEAIEILEEGLKTQQSVGIRPEAGKTLTRLGLAYAAQGKTTEAIEVLQQAIVIHRDIGDRATEAEALANLGQVYTQQNQPEVAIVFYKQSINLTEQIRQGLRTLSHDQQESYTNTVTDRYRTLADLLIAQNRLLEAEQVIELLRLQEVYEYNRSSVSSSGEVRFTPAEQAAMKHYDDSLIAFAKAFDNCSAQANCSEALYQQQFQLTQEWEAVIAELEAETAARERRGDDETALGLRQLPSIGRQIVAAQPNTVMIYPVVQNDRLSILWVTTGGMSNAVQVEVDQKEIAIAVSQFRELMKTCEVSGCTQDADIQAIQAVSQRLYNWLMPPQLRAELEKNQIKNLVFALDRFLRYIPMAALYDGQQYLIENYSISTVAASNTVNANHPLPAANQVSVLGLGLSESVPVDPSKGISHPFNSLTNVPVELSAIVQTDAGNGRGSQGVFRGRTLLDPAFDRAALRTATQYQILHIATHGSFDPINDFNSFLVLGTKEALTISEIRGYGISTFGNLSLVVLSACETALGEAKRYRDGLIPDGKEVTSIAQTFITAGADTLVASLWQVNDPATAALMRQFYASLAANNPEKPVTIAQAMQKAQLSLLHGQAGDSTPATRSGTATIVISPTGTAAATRYAHPYYWSAFTIIGDGL